jgi:2'-5' RNA ligase
MKRIFVGIPISKELQREILSWEQNFIGQSRFDLSVPLGHLPSPHRRQGFGGQAGEKGNMIRWIVPKNLHVTLVPPWPSSAWQVESNKLSAFAKATADKKVIKFAPFEIKFDSISFGPNQIKPRMIWATGQAGEEIKKLKKLIEIVLGRNVDEALGRAFNQHVTLARLALHRSKATGAGFKSENFNRFPIKSLNEKIDWRQTVTSFVLYESHLSPQGADYEVLERFEFEQTD